MKKYLNYAVSFALITCLSPSIGWAEIGQLPRQPKEPAASLPATASTKSPVITAAEADVTAKKTAVEEAKKAVVNRQNELKAAMTKVMQLKVEEKKALQKKHKADADALKLQQKDEMGKLQQTHSAKP